VEISLNIKAELLVKFSLSWFSLPFISIDNIPLLVDSIVLRVDTDVSVFLINIALNFKDLAFLIDN